MAAYTQVLSLCTLLLLFTILAGAGAQSPSAAPTTSPAATIAPAPLTKKSVNTPSISPVLAPLNAPVNNAPVSNAPVDNIAPITNAPVNNAPVNNAPVNNAPVSEPVKAPVGTPLAPVVSVPAPAPSKKKAASPAPVPEVSGPPAPAVEAPGPSSEEVAPAPALADESGAETLKSVQMVVGSLLVGFALFGCLI